MLANLLLLVISTYAEELIGLVEVCRHGSRAPTDYNAYDAGKWPWGRGELTPTGMRMHYLNGVEFRNRYVDGYKLFGPAFNESEIYVRSTDVNRTIESAQSQLLGLFPQGPILESETLKQLAVPPIAIDNLNDMIELLGDSALRFGYQPVPITVTQTKLDYMLRGWAYSTCPRLLEIADEVEKTPAWQANVTDYEKNWQPQLNTAMGYNVSFDAAGYLADAFICDKTEGYSIPAGISNDLYEQMLAINNQSMNIIYTDEGQKLSCSAFFEELGTRLNDTVHDRTSLKFSFYSAHDIDVSAFLHCLNSTKAGPQPPFASTLLFELWNDTGDYTVQTIYNDDILIIPGCNEVARCDLDTFLGILQDKVLPDVAESCKLQNPSVPPRRRLRSGQH